MLLPPSTLLRHGSTYVATVLNVAKAWKHSNVITTFSKSHLMHVMNPWKFKALCEGKPYLVDWRSQDLGSKGQPTYIDLVRSLWGEAASRRLLGHSSLSSCRTRRCPRLYGHNHENQILVRQFKDIMSTGQPTSNVTQAPRRGRICLKETVNTGLNKILLIFNYV
ncbi:hypothetical protein GQ457_05G021000 [Hibiscus cannabinus]